MEEGGGEPLDEATLLVYTNFRIMERSTEQVSKHDKQELTVKGTMDIERAVGYLEGFTQALRGGTVTVEQGEKILVLKPKRTVDVEVEAVQKKGKERFVIEITWRTEEEIEEEPEMEDMRISDREPANRVLAGLKVAEE